jgi:UDP-N-acetylglucosamine--N-acetylmuramyl-(pentapeptide) pyrophosphoryl-undecaprenol N-acetylglucosamine transferase
MAKGKGNGSFNIVFAGGGSGGHVYPTLAVIEALRKRMAELNVPLTMTRMGPDDGYDTLFKNQGVKISSLVSGKIRRYASAANFVDAPKFVIGFIQALFKLFFHMPDVVFSKGGTGALPVVMAAAFYRIPIAIHESDATPGLTNLFSARYAKKVFVSFSAAGSHFAADKVVVTGTPVRDEILNGKTTKELAKENLGFSSSNPLTLILGGSQGSKRINDFILANLKEMVNISQVLHQTGVANLAEVQQLSRAALIDDMSKNRYQAIGYFQDNMGLAFNAADLIIMRPGSTLSEIAAYGLPAILIPLAESANDHQRVNAYEFAKLGGAVVIEESNLLPGIFLNQLKTILTNNDLRTRMSESSAKFFIPGAAEKIVEELMAISAG